VPRTAANVLGVTMLRGEVVPVFDPRPRLGLTDPVIGTPASRVIIANGAGGPLGLWVDSVRQVVRLPASQLEVPPAGVGHEHGAIASIGRLGDRLFAVINLAQLLGPEHRGAG
jgi:purine-binding chemotaxis protein CheW